jgi:hypothetical protein
MAQDAVNVASFSHALLVSADEADALLSGTTSVLRRLRPTELRTRIGLLRMDGVLFATGQLTAASVIATAAGVCFGSDWELRSVEPLTEPINIAPGDGPLWRRLSRTEREIVTGVRPRIAADDRRASSSPTTAAAQLEISELVRIDLPLEDASARMPAGKPLAAVHEDRVEENSGRTIAAEDITGEVKQSADDGDEGDLIASGENLVVPAEQSDPLAAARSRALSFVPSNIIDVDEAYRLLVRLRDTEIKQSFPNVRPEHGILRRTMLQALLDSGVASREDYDELIPSDLKRTTNPLQVEAYLDPLLEILSRVS